MNDLRSYFSDVYAEIKKIIWPTRPELIGASIIVCLLAIFFAIILGAMDAAFSLMVRSIIG